MTTKYWRVLILTNIPHHENDIDSTNDNGLTDHYVENDNIGQTINKGNIDNETLENLVENPNINILGEAMIGENKTDKSSKLSSSISSNVLLTEFDETVEYPSQKGSESSSSGSSLMMRNRGSHHEAVPYPKISPI